MFINNYAKSLFFFFRISCDFLLLLFFGRLLVQRERKEATQIFDLRGFC